jgi:hypothetical protein
VRAVFAVPLQIGVIRLGVVLGHRDVPGMLSSAALADLLVFASAATGALLGPEHCWDRSLTARNRSGCLNRRPGTAPKSTRLPG